MLLNVLMKIKQNHFRQEFSTQARFLESVCSAGDPGMGIRVCYPDPFGKPRAWCALIRLWSNSQQPFDVELRRNECQTLAEVQGIWGSLFENPSRNLTVLLPQCVQEHSMFKYGSALPFRNYHGIHKLTESIVAVRQHTLHFQTKYSPFIARSEVCQDPPLIIHLFVYRFYFARAVDFRSFAKNCSFAEKMLEGVHSFPIVSWICYSFWICDFLHFFADICGFFAQIFARTSVASKQTIPVFSRAREAKRK